MSIQDLQSDLFMDLSTEKQQNVSGGWHYGALGLGGVGVGLGQAGLRYGGAGLGHPGFVGRGLGYGAGLGFRGGLGFGGFY